MTSTASNRLRLDKQATGDNPDAWGERLNNVIDGVDEAFGFAEIAVNGNVVLTAVNFASDQARRMVLRFVGAGGFSVTIPAVQKMYYIDNRCAADVTLKTASTDGAAVVAGSKRIAYCDGATVTTDTASSAPSASGVAVNPTSTLVATNAQAAFAELDTKKASVGVSFVPRFGGVRLGNGQALISSDFNANNVVLTSGPSGFPKYAGLSASGTFQTFGGDMLAVGNLRATGRVIVGEGQTQSLVEMRDDDGGIRYVKNDGGKIGFAGSDDGWKFYTADDGSLWCGQFGDVFTQIETRAGYYAATRQAAIPVASGTQALRTEINGIITIAGSVILGTDGLGNATLSFPYAFPSVCVSCVAMNADYNSGSGPFSVSTANTNRLNATIHAGGIGESVVSTFIRVHFVAVGY